MSVMALFLDFQSSRKLVVTTQSQILHDLLCDDFVEQPSRMMIVGQKQLWRASGYQIRIIEDLDIPVLQLVHDVDSAFRAWGDDHDEFRRWQLPSRQRSALLDNGCRQAHICRRLIKRDMQVQGTGDIEL